MATGQSTLLYLCDPVLVSGQDPVKHLLAEKGKMLLMPNPERRRGTEMSALMPLQKGDEEGWALISATEQERRQLHEAGYWFDR
jgi:hypothetical protein